MEICVPAHRFGEITARFPDPADGIPYLAPEIALLFKAKGTRPKDEADLRLVLPALDLARRAWLASALARVHPGHLWLERVGEPTAGD